MKYQFKLRRGTAAQWTAANPVLNSGEPGIETDTSKMKVGNGISAWIALPYIIGEQGEVGDKGDPGDPGIPGLKGDKGDPGDPGVSGSAAWADITGKPATFPPTIGATGADAVAGNDARLTNARTPTLHAASHLDGGADEISVAGLSGVLADAQKPIIGAGAADAVAGNDARLTNARVPTAHTHPAADISDSSAAGRTLLTAVDAAAQKVALALNNVTNTSDANKPVSTAQQTALDLKANLAAPAFTGVPTAPTAAAATNTTQLATTAYVRTEIASLVAAAPATLDTLNELSAALGNDPNFATSMSTALGLKAPLASPTFTGVVTVPNASFALTKLADVATGTIFYRKTAGAGAPETQTLATLKADLALAKADVGLGNVDNTSDVNKPVSTAQQTALNLKADLASPALTGTPTAPTAAAGTNTTQVATTAFVEARAPKHVTKQSTAVALAASTTVNLPLLDIAVLANEVWTLDYEIPFTVSGGVAGLKPIFTLPAGATGQMDGFGTVATVTGVSYSYSTTPTVAMAVAFGTASFTGFIRVRATITIGATAGNIRIGVATGASAAGNLLLGCSVLATKQ